MNHDTDQALDFMRRHHRSVLIVRRPDGQPAPSPVVHGVDQAAQVVVSSRETAYKVRNLRRDPRIVICAFTDEFFGPWVSVTGQAKIVALPQAMDGLEGLYRQIAGEHPDWDEFRAAMEREQRVLIAVTPLSAGPDRQG